MKFNPSYLIFYKMMRDGTGLSAARQIMFFFV